MEIKPGVQVVDKSGKVVCSVIDIERGGWSGEVKKFIVHRPDRNFFFTPEDVLEATDAGIKLKTALN